MDKDMFFQTFLEVFSVEKSALPPRNINTLLCKSSVCVSLCELPPQCLMSQLAPNRVDQRIQDGGDHQIEQGNTVFPMVM